jgi:hypothetical protein
MARVKMSDEEREAKRKARAAISFSNAAYQHYDPAMEGYGNLDDWLAVAEALAAAKGFTGASKPRTTRFTGRQSDLIALGLDVMPADLTALKSAFRKKMFGAHPDHGGSNEAARLVIEAYTRLLNLF